MKKQQKSESPQKINRVTNFNYADNEISNFTKRALDGEKNNTTFYNLILGTLFDGPSFKENAQKIFANVKNSKAVCAKIFVKNDIAFKCLDCEKDPTCVICKECYENGDHKGHRVIINKNVAGCCDCGDPDAWSEKGFCKNHPGYAKFTPTYSIDDVPMVYRDKFLKTYEEAFYNLFTLAEELAHQKNSDSNKPLNDLINSTAHGLLSSLDFCAEKTLALYLLLCKLFTQKLSSNNRSLYIKTGNLKKLEFAKEISNCELTYLECLFAYCRFFSNDVQKKIEELAIKLFIDYEFKQYIAQTYIKMIHYIFYLEDSTIVQTKISGLNVQLFTAEEFAVIAIDSPYFNDFLDLYIKLLEAFVSNTSQEQFYNIMDFKSFFDFVLQKKLGRVKLLENFEYTFKFIKSASILDYSYRIDLVNKVLITPDLIDEKTYLFEVDIKNLQLIDYLFIEASSVQDDDKRQKIISEIGLHFISLLKQNLNLYKINRDYIDKSRTLLITSYRAFGLFLKNIIDKPSFESLNDYISNTLKLNPKEAQVIFEHVFDVCIRSYGFVQDNDKKSFEKASVLYEGWCNIYRSPKLRYLDIDVFLLQISIAFSSVNAIQAIFSERYSLNPNLRDLLKSVEAGKLDQDKLKTGLEDINKLKNKDSISMLIDDMFIFLINLGMDQISLANLFYQKDKLFEYKKHPEFTKKAYQNLFINFFQKNFKMDLKTIQETLSERIIYPKIDFEASLTEISTFSTSTKAFTLKEEYKNSYEPFSLSKDHQLHVEINEIIKNRLKKDKKDIFDMIGGNKSFAYEFKSSLNQAVWEKIFDLDILELGIKLITLKESPLKRDNFCRSVIKLVHLGLEFRTIYPAITGAGKLINLIDENKLIDNLIEMASDQAYEDVQNCIEKIKKSYEILKNFDPELITEPSIIKKESSEASKDNKELIKKRMEDIKKQFSQKQDQFLKKFKSEITDEGDKEVKNEHICNICHLEINLEKESYGAPAYFGYSSIYSTAIKNIKKDTIISLKKFKGQADVLRKILLSNKPTSIFPVITTCSHFIHKECFDKTGRKNSLPNQDATFYFNNELEYTCTLCKFLSNTFAIIKDYSKEINTEEKPLDLELDEGQYYNLILNLTPVKIESSKVDDIFNDVIHLELLKAEEKSKKENSLIDDFNLKSFDSLFDHTYNTISFSGVPSFLKKQLMLMRSVRMSYMQFYQSYDLNSKYEYFDRKKDLILKFLTLFTQGKIAEVNDSVKNLMFSNYNDPVALNCDSEAFLLEDLQHLLISAALTKTEKYLLSRKLVRLQIFHKMMQIYIKKKILKDEIDTISSENFLSMLELEKDSMVKLEIINSLLPTVRKIFCFTLVNFDANPDIVAKAINQDFLSDIEEFDFYSKNSLLELDSECFLSKKIFELIAIKNETIESWFNELELISSTKNVIGDTILVSDLEISFQFPDLPPNFLELTNSFMERKCSLCKKHPEVGGRCICLICRDVICSSTCKKDDKSMLYKGGNLNNHSKKVHGGVSCFLNTEEGDILLINAPKNLRYAGLYVDKFGYEIDKKKKDWKEFCIDKNLLSTLREKLLSERLPQEIMYGIMNKGSKIMDNIY